MIFQNAFEVEYMPRKFLCFDDVLLMPQISELNSRNDDRISLSTSIGRCKIEVPIISSNMDTVTNPLFANLMENAGGMGILHRFYNGTDKYLTKIQKLIDENSKHIAFSVGCDEDETFTVINYAIDANNKYAITNNTNPKEIIVCLDVAHGGMRKVINHTAAIKKEYGNSITLISGNVSSASQAIMLEDAGADVLKVGVGGGSCCTTRIVTGHGCPTLASVIQIRQSCPNIGIIADGGIKSSGDIVKALAAGADAVMIGSLFAACRESAAQIQNINGKNMKFYRGQSSRHFLNDRGKSGVAAEGETVLIPMTEFKEVFDELCGGIRSGLTYSGAENIKDLYRKAIFIEITPGGYKESTPHALTRYN